MSDSREGLAAALQERLGLGIQRLRISETDTFLDLLWDEAMGLAAIEALERPLVVESATGTRRIVVQRVREELRYWLTTDFDPYALSTTAETELGILPSIDELARLCIEFVVDVMPVADLTTPRTVNGVPRGATRTS